MPEFDIQLEQMAIGFWRVTCETYGTDRVFRRRKNALAFAHSLASLRESKLIIHGGAELDKRSSECPQASFTDRVQEPKKLSQYFPANVIHEQSTLGLQGAHTQTATIAVLFVDIVGFTGFLTSVSQSEAIATLQAFFALIERSVETHNGTLEKFLGDGAMATFGAQSPKPSIALDAVRCARSMLVAVKEWNIERGRADMPPLQIEIGAHYGEVIFGSIGVHTTEFAVIGECVNIANRLEAMAHDPESAIVLSKSLFDRACFEASGGDPALEGFALSGKCRIGGMVDSIAVATHGRIWNC
jgi:adenylate cyclase